MADLFTFHKTVRGYSHVKHEIPCEDASGSYVAEDGSFRIIVVADGHGDSACIRSELGSQMAVNAAMEHLKSFAEAIIGELQTEQENKIYYRLLREREQEVLLKHSTDSIIAKWKEAVYKDLDEHPLSEEEIQNSGRYAQKYQAGEALEHVYGTTLIAGLWIKDVLVLIHQGDGRCDVFYADGKVDQPIPWDERCHENVTTSMCDPDITTGIRYCIIDCKKTPVIACYMGSDGVEDSYINNEDQSGTHVFYSNLTCEIIEQGTEKLEDYLSGYLPGFSQQGSGDDVSVAGIVDLEAVRKLVPSFKAIGKRYEIQESMLLYQRKLDSMDRKHTFLKEAVEKERGILERKDAQYQEETEKLSENQKRMEQLETDLRNAKDRLEEEWQEQEQNKKNLAEMKFVGALDNIIKNAANDFWEKKSEKQLRVEEFSQKKEKGMLRICEQEKQLQMLEEELNKVRSNYEKTNAEYEEYHARYCEIEDYVRQLQEEWNALEQDGLKEEETIFKTEAVATEMENKATENNLSEEKETDQELVSEMKKTSEEIPYEYEEQAVVLKEQETSGEAEMEEEKFSGETATEKDEESGKELSEADEVLEETISEN